MARPKLQFTDEQNFLITQMVEINKTLDEIANELDSKFDLRISLPTLSTHIKSLGLSKVDCRKWNTRSGNNHKDGYVKDGKVESEKRVPSKYKLKKYFDGEGQISVHDAKGLGYDENDIPLFFTMNLSKEGTVMDVEMRMDTNLLSFKGGEKCAPGSKRWWMIQRMRFDYGDKLHPLVPGQHIGDWRGAVDRFKYDDNGYMRLNEITPNEMIYLQQEAWERYVDAVANCVGTTKRLSEGDRHKHNRYIINSMNQDELDELMLLGPDVIYYYVPQYLYGAVVNYCLIKMENDGRVNRDDAKIVEGIRKIMANAGMNIEFYDADKITLDVIKKCLGMHPNDYDLVIKICIGNALNANLIRPAYTKSLIDMASKLYFKAVKDPNGYNQCDTNGDWLSVFSDKLHKAFYGQAEDLNTVCKKYGIIFGGGYRV